MGDDIAVSVRNVSKMYMLYARPQDRLKQALLWRFGRRYGREFWALRDISFEVKKGEALGIIGKNGSGKSTLLQIIAGTLQPTTGEVKVNGRVAALLELGSGFNPEYTGRENVYLNGAILGFSHEEMDSLFDEIAAFADIGEFIDQPVKLYSSGMFVRLAFAVQACVQPDVLIVDEALAVGDIFFQQKCHARMERLLAHQTAIIIVSHDMATIEKYSTQAMLLDQGHCHFIGQPNEAVRHYYHQVESTSKISPALLIENSPARLSDSDNFVEPDAPFPGWPSADAFLNPTQAVAIGDKSIARCTGVALCNKQGQPCTVFQIGEVAYFYYEFELLQDIGVPIGGIEITSRTNITVYAKNSLQHLLKVPPTVKKGARLCFRQTIELAIAPGEYTFLVSFATMSAYDYARKTDMSHAQLNSKYQTILRIVNAGTMVVQERTQGLGIPFYGLVDLNGEASLSITKISENGNPVIS